MQSYLLSAAYPVEMASPIFLHISVHAHQDEMMIPGGVKHLLCWLLYHRSNIISPGQVVFELSDSLCKTGCSFLAHCHFSSSMDNEDFLLNLSGT